MDTKAEPSILQVGVIGAGIAGLAAAIALRRAGHEVDIYERSSWKQEIGAAITMTPNGNRVLDKWGFDAKKASETGKGQFRLVDHATLQPYMKHNFDDYEERYGAAFNAFHRVDMHEQMRDLARDAGARIHLGRVVTGIDCEEGVMRFQDEEVKKDLIVVADGFKSPYVHLITGEVIPTKRTGKSVYRCLVPVKQLRDDPVISPLLEEKPFGQVVTADPTFSTLFVAYPCRVNEVMNLAIFHKTKPHQAAAVDWNSPATVKDVLEDMEPLGFHPALSGMATHADSIACFTLGDRDTLPRMNRGRAVLIGDAGHPMQPTHAAAGNMAVEDAAAMEVLFSHWTSEDSVSQRLELLNRLRLPRSSVTQLLSNAMFYMHEPDEILLARIRKYYKGPLPPRKSMGWDRSLADFFFPYDIYAEAEKAMKYRDDPTGMPDNAVKYFE